MQWVLAKGRSPSISMGGLTVRANLDGSQVMPIPLINKPAEEGYDENAVRFSRYCSRYAPGSLLLWGIQGNMLEDPSDAARLEALEEWLTLETAAQRLGFGLAIDAAAAQRAATAFSRRPEWWARMAAADLVRTFPEFDDGTVLPRLRDDPHPVVRATAEATFWQDIDIGNIIPGGHGTTPIRFF